MVNASVSLSERAVAEKPVMLKDPGALRSLNPEVRENLGRGLYQANFGDTSFK